MMAAEEEDRACHLHQNEQRGGKGCIEHGSRPGALGAGSMRASGTASRRLSQRDELQNSQVLLTDCLGNDRDQRLMASIAAVRTKLVAIELAVVSSPLRQ